MSDFEVSLHGRVSTIFLGHDVPISAWIVIQTCIVNEVEQIMKLLSVGEGHLTIVGNLDALFEAIIQMFNRQVWFHGLVEEFSVGAEIVAGKIAVVGEKMVEEIVERNMGKTRVFVV